MKDQYYELYNPELDDDYGVLKQEIKTLIATFFERFPILECEDGLHYIQIPKKLRKKIIKFINCLYKIDSDPYYAVAALLDTLLGSADKNRISYEEFINHNALDHIEHELTRVTISALIELVFPEAIEFRGTDGAVMDPITNFLPNLSDKHIYRHVRGFFTGPFEEVDGFEG